MNSGYEAGSFTMKDDFIPGWARIWWYSTAVVMILGIAVQSSRLGNVLNEIHAFRLTQTAWTIREFMQGNWSVLSPLPIFGPPWNTPFEFPLFQGFAASLGNVISLQPDWRG